MVADHHLTKRPVKCSCVALATELPGNYNVSFTQPSRTLKGNCGLCVHAKGLAVGVGGFAGSNCLLTRLYIHFKNLNHMETPINSVKVKDRMVELINSNQLDMSCELQIFEAINKKYGFQTLSDYARSQKISYNGALNRIKSGKEQYVLIANQIFVF
jgi:hypothetical protein